MNDGLESDQLINWSEIYARKINSNTPAKTKNTAAQTASTRGRAAGIIDRALQAVWKAGVQMRARSRARPKVLLVHQPIRRQARNGLHPPGPPRTGRGLPGQLPHDKRYPRRTLCDQPRTVAAQGTFLGDQHASLRGERESSVPLRCRGDGNSPGQYARRGGTLRCARTRGKGGKS